MVNLKHSKRTITVESLLNNGPDTTVISEKVAQYLGLQAEEKQVEKKSALIIINVNPKTVSFEIVIYNGNSNININAYTASYLDVPNPKYCAN